MEYPQIRITGDTSAAVVFGDEISEEINAAIRTFDKLLNERQLDGVYETVPTYCALTVHYAPEIVRYHELEKALWELLAETGSAEKANPVVIEIPVLYGGDYGPDLNYVAQYNHMTTEEVIRIHSGAEYLIYMLGFTPGFSYMGGMDARIETPRLKTPRVLIPAGSVGIAGKQTGIYPIDSPGGWQLIGRTPVRLYDAERDTPILLDAGMKVKFVPVNEEEYLRIKSRVEEGRYRCHTYVGEER